MLGSSSVPLLLGHPAPARTSGSPCPPRARPRSRRPAPRAGPTSRAGGSPSRRSGPARRRSPARGTGRRDVVAVIVGTPAVVARDRHVGVQPGQLLLARDLRQRASHDDDRRDHRRATRATTTTAATVITERRTRRRRDTLRRVLRRSACGRRSAPRGRAECAGRANRYDWHSDDASARPRPLPTAARRSSVPTYAYACTACGHAFEIVQSFSDDSLSVCPECEGRLRKVFSSVGRRVQGLGLLPQRRARRCEVDRAEPRRRRRPTATPASSTSSSTSSSSPAPRRPRRRRPRRVAAAKPAASA